MTEVSKRAALGAEGSTFDCGKKNEPILFAELQKCWQPAAEQISRESDEKDYGLLSNARLTETFISVSGLVSFVFTVSTLQLHTGDEVKSNTRRNSTVAVEGA